MIEVLESMPLFVLKLDVGYARAVHLGEGPTGGRSVFPVEGGSFAGERLRGTVIAGADWVTWRSDGAMIIDVRLTLRTDDDASIGMSYLGLAYADAATMARFRSRELLSADEVHVRTTPRFETGDSRYTWLNTLVAVAKGMRTAEGPLYHVFAIR